MIRLGLRLTLGGGRDAAARLVVIAAAVALGVGVLLVTLAGINAVSSQNARYAWLETGAGLHAARSATGAPAAPPTRQRTRCGGSCRPMSSTATS